MSRCHKKNNTEKLPRFCDNSCIERFAEERKMNDFLSEFRLLLDRENYSGSFRKFNKEKVIDLDEYETNLKKTSRGHEKPTVDCVVGLDKRNLMMVEMKFDVKTLKMKNVAKKIIKKHSYSTTLLRCSENFICYNKAIVLLDDKDFEIHKNNLMRELNVKVNDFDILRVSEFYNKYFSQVNAS